MPVTKEGQRLESRVTAFTALLTLIAGLLLDRVSFSGWRSHAVATVDHLVKHNADYPSFQHNTWQNSAEIVPVLTTQRIMEALFWISLLVILSAVIGIVGALMRRKGVVITYVILASALSLVVLVSAAQTSQRRALVGPLIMYQVDHLCNASTYIQLSSGLGCDFAANFSSSRVPVCDALCQFRVQSLQRLNGCTVLPDLCSSFRYSRLGGGGCFTAAAESGQVVYKSVHSNMSYSACKSFCDQDIGCSTFITLDAKASEEEQCLSITNTLTANRDPTNWTDITALYFQQKGDLSKGTGGGTWNHKCYKRAEPEVLVEFLAHGLHLAIATAVLGVILLMSTICTCFILYNMSMSRRGLPTATELGLMLFCPCCSDKIRRKYNEDYMDEIMKSSEPDSSSEESDEEGKTAYVE